MRNLCEDCQNAHYEVDEWDSDCITLAFICKNGCPEASSYPVTECEEYEPGRRPAILGSQQSCVIIHEEEEA